jgi:hypothetical protein
VVSRRETVRRVRIYMNMEKWVILGVAGLGVFGVAGLTAKPESISPVAPTYSADIAPILFEKCTPCHRPGQVAPFTLQNYEDAKRRSGIQHPERIRKMLQGDSRRPCLI